MGIDFRISPFDFELEVDPDGNLESLGFFRIQSKKVEQPWDAIISLGYGLVEITFRKPNGGRFSYVDTAVGIAKKFASLLIKKELV